MPFQCFMAVLTSQQTFLCACLFNRLPQSPHRFVVQGAILKFAYIPRPLIFFQILLFLFREAVVIVLEKIFQKDSDVFFSRAQRRHFNLQHIQTVIQVLPKALFFNSLQKILIRRRDDPHVQIDHPIAANTHDLPLLNDTQQLRLHSRRNISDLVQKNRPVIRPFKITDFPVFVRSGKRAADIAEELGFQQIFGDRCTVHADKRSVLTL